MIPTITWHLPRPPKSRYRGGFPLHFEDNLIQLLGYPEQILQPFGGRAEHGIRVDLDPLTEPDVVADAHELPFADESFDCVILDPPYSDEEALELYGITRRLEPAKFVAEAVRVLRPGGDLVIYTDREPRRPPRCNHRCRIMVTLRPGHSPRVCMVFQKRKPGMPFYGSEAGEELPDAEPSVILGAAP
ncbi:MAG: ubiE/COQ5 methyltransferase family [Gaiellaceae bacterium]|nr:ubiE/COQ5 methyltransferase family [Gaiellaceae bacterium]